MIDNKSGNTYDFYISSLSFVYSRIRADSVKIENSGFNNTRMSLTIEEDQYGG